MALLTMGASPPNPRSGLLQVEGLKTYFTTEEGVVRAVDGITLDVDRGEILAIVGESGSGKSVASLSILRLVADPPGRIVAGSIRFDGEDLAKASEERMQAIRGNRIAMIFQDPMTSLNPYLTVGDQLVEVLELHKKMKPQEARVKAAEALAQVGIADADSRLDDYPHQLSGGMRQRVMIAMALLCDPALLLADEPTTALDVTIQAQILELVRALKDTKKTGVILITHDLGVVANMADRAAVMYAGRIVEEGPVEALFAEPRHPYTIGLLRSVPRVDGDKAESLIPIPGLPPSLAHVPAGCPFHPRCGFALDVCKKEFPADRIIDGKDSSARQKHVVRCHVEDVSDAAPASRRPDDLDRASAIPASVQGAQR